MCSKVAIRELGVGEMENDFEAATKRRKKREEIVERLHMAKSKWN